MTSDLSELGFPDQCQREPGSIKVLEEFSRHWKVMWLVNSWGQSPTPPLLPDLGRGPPEDSPATQKRR